MLKYLKHKNSSYHKDRDISVYTLRTVTSSAVDDSISYDTHRQALSKCNSTHMTRHAATSPIFNIGIYKV